MSAARSTRRPVPLVALVASLVAATLAPLAVHAQSAAPSRDSLPFHRGQWGAEFDAGTQFTGVGALWFHSPRAAWTADVEGGALHDQFGGSSDNLVTRGGATLSLGHRWYRPLGDRIAAYAGLGVTGSMTSLRQTADASTSRQSVRSGGAFGNLGGAYFITPHLSIGAAASLAASAHRQKLAASGPDGQTATDRTSGYDASFGASRLTATLFF